MFNQQSGLVKIWVNLVKNGVYSLAQVPVISNLKDVVTLVVGELAPKDGEPVG